MTYVKAALLPLYSHNDRDVVDPMEAESAPYIRFRLGNIDSYQASPTNLDRDDFPKVPIIRIWGAADETGQNVPIPSWR